MMLEELIQSKALEQSRNCILSDINHVFWTKIIFLVIDKISAFHDRNTNPFENK